MKSHAMNHTVGKIILNKCYIVSILNVCLCINEKRIWLHSTLYLFHMNNIIYGSSRSPFLIFPYLRVEQVQEKKVKKIAEMNVDPSKTMGNGSIASSSNLNNPKPSLENGGYPDSDRSFNYLSSDFSFPPGGIPSLRLPVVVVFIPSMCNYFF